MDETPETYASDDVYYFNAHRPTETVRALQGRYQAFAAVRDRTLKAVFGEHGQGIRSIRENARAFGTGHVVYLVETESGRELAYRGNVGLGAPEHYMALEPRFTRLARDAGWPTNTVLAADTRRLLGDFDYQIMEVLPGRDAETEWEGSKEDYDRISYELGRLVAREYRMPVEGWGRFADTPSGLRGAKERASEYLTAYLGYDVGVLVRARVLPPETGRAILAHFDSRRAMIDEGGQAYLVHHDLADHNIRYDPHTYDIAAVYDWENAVAFDPLCELGSAPTWLCHYPRAERMRRGFLDELGSAPPDMDAKIALYFLRTMLWKAAFAVKGNRLSERHERLLNTAFRDNGLDVERPFADAGTMDI